MRRCGFLHGSIEAYAPFFLGLLVLTIALLLQYPERFADLTSPIRTRIPGRKRILGHVLESVVTDQVLMLSVARL